MAFGVRSQGVVVPGRRRSELGLLLMGALLVTFASLLPSLALTNALPENEIAFLVGLFGVLVLVQGANRILVPNADPVLMPVSLVLNGLGYVMINRIDPSSGSRQLVWTVVGVGAYVTTLMIVKRSRDLERYRFIILFVAFGLLVSPLVPGIADSSANINGTKLWIGIGGLATFQPVELVKLLLVIFFASYFVEKRELFTISTRRVGNHLLPDLRAFGPITVAAVMSLVVILAERDIGFALLLFVVFLAMLWVTTGRWTYVVIGFVAFIAAMLIANQLLAVVNARIELWIDPWKYYNTPGYYAGFQPVQAELAFGRGGIFGTGLGLGLSASPLVLPIATSDMIFAVFGEELGLVGTSALVAAFVLMAGAGFRAAIRARSEFAKLVALGLTATLTFQAVFIFAGVVRLLPLTGVTVPFVSYGGSSLLANYVLLALLMRISDEGNTPQGSLDTTDAWNRTSSAAVTGTSRR